MAGEGGRRRTGRHFLLEHYRDYLEFERSLSPATVEAYCRDVEDWIQFGESRGLNRPGRTSLGDLRDWISALGSRGLAPASVRRARSALRSYYAFLLEEGVVDEDPTERLESPKKSLRLPDHLNQKEVEALLAAPDGSSPLYWRDVALLEVMYSTGIRVSELVGMSISDFIPHEGLLLVFGKGSKERLVPVGPPACRALDQYLTKLRPKLDRGKGSQRIFLGARGAPLRREIVWRVVKKCAERAGIDSGRVHPHVLRHSFATHLIQGGADLVAVQELLGHADIATTQIYTHLDRRYLLEQHGKFHPRGGW